MRYRSQYVFIFCFLQLALLTGTGGNDCVRAEEVHLGGMVVTRHEEVRLIFVGGRICGRGLRRCRQALEVELIRVPLPVDLGHNVLVVVVPAGERGPFTPNRRSPSKSRPFRKNSLLRFLGKRFTIARSFISMDTFAASDFRSLQLHLILSV